MSSPKHRSRFGMEAIIVMGLLLVVGVCFLAVVHRQVQANSGMLVSIVDLNFSPEVVEFEGFINYGSPIQTTSTDALGNPVTIVLTESRIEQPIFTNRTLVSRMKSWWREWSLAAKQVLRNLRRGDQPTESPAE